MSKTGAEKLIYTRVGPFVRGMGLSWWHPKYGWAGDPEVDKKNYDEMAITSHRDWGYNKTTPHLYYKRSDGRTLVTCGGVYPGGSCFEDGTPAGDNWCSPDAFERVMQTFGFFENVEEKDALEVHVLGNEQSLLAQNGNHEGNYEYAGFDKDTQKEFHEKWIPERFGSIKEFNRLCKTDYSSFSDIYPLENERVKTEYWLFLRNAFESFLESLTDKVKAVNPDMKFGYAKLMGRRNPTCDDAKLKFMDCNCQNLYWHWYRSTARFSVKLDELAGNAPDKPIYLTEFGLRNMFDIEDELIAERQYKQLLPIIFMRPQVKGVYIFTYAGQNDYSHQTNNKPGDNPEFSWGMVWPDRTKRRCFYAVSECFQMFKKIDDEIPGLTVQPLAAITNQLTDELLTGKYTCEAIARPLYAKGVPLHCLPSDDTEAIRKTDEPIILADEKLFINPNGTFGEGAALSDYLNADSSHKILCLDKGVPTPMYDIPNSEDNRFEAKNKDINLLDPEEVWNTLAEFIHGDFLAGRCDKSLPGNRVRILESDAGEFTWDIQQSLMFSGENVYLITVNTADAAVEKMSILIGSHIDTKLSFKPELLFAGNEVALKSDDFKAPDWINGNDTFIEKNCLVVENLDTYAVIYIGKINR